METLINQGGAAGNPVIDTGAETFAQDVIEESMNRPVIVDFWAPWCGPCKQLGPLLEKTVANTNGKVRLCKVNIDENQQIAQQLRIQSIPAVFAFDKGQPVDGFIGMQPESQIKSFVERLAGPIGPSPVDQALELAKEALDAGDFDTAANMYSQVLRQAPGEVAALAGLIRCQVATGDLAGAKELIESLEDEMKSNPDIEGAMAALALAEQSGDQVDTAELEARLAANENDHQARLDLAMAHYAAGRNEEAVDGLIEIVRRDRAWNDAAARQQLVKLFEALGNTDPVTIAGRRKLSSVFFA